MPATMIRSLLLSPALAAFAALLLVAGCGKPPTRVSVGNQEQILHKGNKSDPQELDPHIVQRVPEHHILQSLIENLVTEDPKDLRPVPGQAERWDISPDGTVYTFHLRAGIRWSNGELLSLNSALRSLLAVAAGESILADRQNAHADARLFEYDHCTVLKRIAYSRQVRCEQRKLPFGTPLGAAAKDNHRRFRFPA